jgi:hypothetical protein
MKYSATQLSMRKHHWRQARWQQLIESARKGNLSARKRIYKMKAADCLSQEAVNSLGIQRATDEAEGWNRLAELIEIVSGYRLTTSNKL